MAGYVFLVLAAACVLLWLLFGRGFGRRPAGMPDGEVVYCGHREPGSRLLHAPNHHLAGKPDYIVKQGDEFTPVEVKSGPRPKKLYRSDRMQLTAQALLVEAEFGKRPARGYVLYPDRAFDVAIRPKDIDRLTEALQIMRKARETKRIPDAYPSWFLCPTCPNVRCPKRVKRTRGKTDR